MVFLLFICSEENVIMLLKKLCNGGIADFEGSVAFISIQKNQASTILFLCLIENLFYNFIHVSS